VGLQALRDRSLAFARANVVLGTRMRGYLSSRNVGPASFTIIENWADGTALQPKDTARSELRARLGLAGRFVVGYSGNLGRAHEFETLLAAAQALRTEPTFVFLMIGGGAQMQVLRERVVASGLTSFRFLPYQAREALADSMAAADVHWVSLIPELEGLIVPSKVYGVFAAGRPAIFIGDPDGELAQVIRTNGCGVTLQLGEGLRLAAELRRLQSDSEHVEEMGRRARALFERHFTLDSATDKWIRLLEEMGVVSQGCMSPVPG
jgi:glycosyltransferase involved in cell wall biosynthesis